jgi:DNA-binding transcriptional MerR regulator
MEKTAAAFRTIGEVSVELGVKQHVLRYWESCFPQLRPITRAGNRRYYRPEDVVLVRRIHVLLGQEGYTVRGVQKLLSGGAPAGVAGDGTVAPDRPAAADIAELKAIRAALANALGSA